MCKVKLMTTFQIYANDSIGSLSTAPRFVACVTSFSVLAIIITVPDFNNYYRLKNHIYI